MPSRYVGDRPIPIVQSHRKPVFIFGNAGNTRSSSGLSRLNMVDWSEPKKPVESGLGGDRGQVNETKPLHLFVFSFLLQLFD